MAPSAAHHWFHCPGWLHTVEQLPRKTSAAANLGTAAHSVLSRCLVEDLEAAAFLGAQIPVQDGDVLEEYLCDDAMVEGIDLALRTVDEYLDRGFTCESEQRVSLEHLAADTFGTVDMILLHEKLGELVVGDFKYGTVVRVPAKENPQLLSYLSGVRRQYGERCEIKKMTVFIVQPRGGGAPVRFADVSVEELDRHEENFRLAAAAALAPDAPRVAGLHCEWCAASAVCPELRAFAKQRSALEFGFLAGGKTAVATRPPLPELDDAALGELLQHLDLIEDWCAAVRSYALKRAVNSGKLPDGFKLVRKRTQRKWLDEDKTAAVLRVVYELDDARIFSKKLLSPAAIEKLLGKQAKENLKELWRFPPGDPTLAPLDDKREVLVADAARELGLEQLRTDLQNSVALIEQQTVLD